MTTTVDNGSLTDYDVASDTIAGAEYQKVKLTDPTSGSSSAIGVAANPLRIDPTGTTTQPVSVVNELLATRIDEGAVYIYLGYAAIGAVESDAVWRVCRYTIENVSGKKWADGDANFDNVWNNRASLTYL